MDGFLVAEAITRPDGTLSHLAAMTPDGRDSFSMAVRGPGDEFAPAEAEAMARFAAWLGDGPPRALVARRPERTAEAIGAAWARAGLPGGPPLAGGIDAEACAAICAARTRPGAPPVPAGVPGGPIPGAAARLDAIARALCAAVEGSGAAPGLRAEVLRRDASLQTVPDMLRAAADILEDTGGCGREAARFRARAGLLDAMVFGSPLPRENGAVGFPAARWWDTGAGAEAARAAPENGRAAPAPAPCAAGWWER